MTAGRFSMAKVLLASACGLVLLSGCASEPPELDVSEVTGDGILPPETDPLLAYVQPPGALVGMARAQDILAAECMKRFGFSEFQSQDYDRMAASFVESDERLYGITNTSVASIYGYMPVPVPPPAPVSDELASESYMKVLVGDVEALAQGTAVEPGPGGVPIGGCMGEARTTLSGNPNGVPSTDTDLGRNLIVESWQSAWNDPESVAAKAEWSSCMSDAGYDRNDPVMDELGFEPRDPNEGKKASEEEVTEALADITCKEETDFVSKVSAVNVRYSNQLIEQHQLELNESKDFYVNALQKANEVITNGK